MNGLGTSRMEEIKIEHFGWEQNLLLESKIVESQ
jgi:hypothetical protein